MFRGRQRSASRMTYRRGMRCYTRQVKDLGNCPVCDEPIQKYQRVTCSVACSRIHRSRNQRGHRNPDWKGGRYVEPGKGYVMIRQPDHPRARQNGYVLEHILVMEAQLGRPLAPGEEVHHRNHIRNDNRPENLELYGSHAEHFALHVPLVPRHPPCVCGRRAVARGMCANWYGRWKRNGKNARPCLPVNS
jgi:hypothetical protein